jgi:hypothetical protein
MRGDLDEDRQATAMARRRLVPSAVRQLIGVAIASLALTMVAFPTGAAAVPELELPGEALEVAAESDTDSKTAFVTLFNGGDQDAQRVTLRLDAGSQERVAVAADPLTVAAGAAERVEVTSRA